VGGSQSSVSRDAETDSSYAIYLPSLPGLHRCCCCHPPPADVTDSGSKLSTTKYTKLYYRYVFLQNGCGAAQSVNLDLANKPKVSAKQWKLQRVLALDVKVAKWVGEFARGGSGTWNGPGIGNGNGLWKGEGKTAHTKRQFAWLLWHVICNWQNQVQDIQRDCLFCRWQTFHFSFCAFPPLTIFFNFLYFPFFYHLTYVPLGAYFALLAY